MKKEQIVKAVAVKTGVENDAVKKVVDSMLDEIASALKDKQEVCLFGFGKFVARKYNNRVCFNPYTREEINLPESWQPAFIPGNTLRRTVNTLKK